MNIKLVVPTLNHKEEALAYRKEHFDNNETIINGSELLDKIDSYEEWLEKKIKIQNRNSRFKLGFDTFLLERMITRLLVSLI